MEKTMLAFIIIIFLLVLLLLSSFGWSAIAKFLNQELISLVSIAVYILFTASKSQYILSAFFHHKQSINKQIQR
jgi:ABC-type uncharacterized transport system permease subunit